MLSPWLDNLIWHAAILLLAVLLDLLLPEPPNLRCTRWFGWGEPRLRCSASLRSIP